MIPVEVLTVQVEERTGLPVVLLRELVDPHRVLPIFVGESEALAIALGLDGTESPRPLTHDLLAALLGRTGAHLDEVAVTEVRDGTFYAELRLSGAMGAHTVSSRPSDALALALRVDAPVVVAEAVLDEGGLVAVEAIDVDFDDDDDTDLEDSQVSDAVIAEFRSQLDQLNPEDFGTPDN